MTSVYDSEGRNMACTVIEVSPNVVTQVKSEDSDGYSALQIGYGDAKVKNTTKAGIGHFEKAGTSPKRILRELRNSSMDKALGDLIQVEEVFEENDMVNVVGVSKGKGFQGVVKRYNFRGVGDATHGQHNRQRAPGSIGAASYPAKVVKGMKMAGRMGGDRVMMKNLKVLKVLAEQNLLVVKGAVPGHKGSYIIIEK
ncbi:UNVERIFIED_CONTAM: hypothetical protein GTU68_045848 [Idotea baltica]|nr:hypothetical protein [Idotea baltica]